MTTLLQFPQMILAEYYSNMKALQHHMHIILLFVNYLVTHWSLYAGSLILVVTIQTVVLCPHILLCPITTMIMIFIMVILLLHKVNLGHIYLLNVIYVVLKDMHVQILLKYINVFCVLIIFFNIHFINLYAVFMYMCT